MCFFFKRGQNAQFRKQGKQGGNRYRNRRKTAHTPSGGSSLFLMRPCAGIVAVCQAIHSRKKFFPCGNQKIPLYDKHDKRTQQNINRLFVAVYFHFLPVRGTVTLHDIENNIRRQHLHQAEQKKRTEFFLCFRDMAFHIHHPSKPYTNQQIPDTVWQYVNKCHHRIKQKKSCRNQTAKAHTFFLHGIHTFLLSFRIFTAEVPYFFFLRFFCSRFSCRFRKKDSASRVVVSTER